MPKFAELLAEAAQLSEQIDENSTNKTDPPPRRSPSVMLSFGVRSQTEQNQGLCYCR
jgi:hypothetical protein